MNSFVLKLVTAFTILSAQSAWAIDDEVPAGTKIDYQSWCEGDAIKTRDEDGQAYTAYDCYDASRRCVETTIKKNDWYIVNATCK